MICPMCGERHGNIFEYLSDEEKICKPCINQLNNEFNTLTDEEELEDRRLDTNTPW